MTQSFEVLFNVRLNKRLSKQSRCRICTNPLLQPMPIYWSLRAILLENLIQNRSNILSRKCFWKCDWQNHCHFSWPQWCRQYTWATILVKITSSQAAANNRIGRLSFIKGPLWQLIGSRGIIYVPNTPISFIDYVGYFCAIESYCIEGCSCFIRNTLSRNIDFACINLMAVRVILTHRPFVPHICVSKLGKHWFR